MTAARRATAPRTGKTTTGTPRRGQVAELPAAAAARPRKRTAERSEELLAIAASLIVRHGYHGVGMRAIADEAGIRAASLYHHFRSKDDLVKQIVFRASRDFIVEQLSILDGEGTYAVRLEELVRSQVVYLQENRDACYVLLHELRALPPEVVEEVQRPRREYQHRIASFIAEGVEAGEFTCEDPALFALAMLDMINRVHVWFEPGGRYSIEELADKYARLVVTGMLGARSSRRPSSRRAAPRSSRGAA